MSFYLPIAFKIVPLKECVDFVLAYAYARTQKAELVYFTPLTLRTITSPEVHQLCIPHIHLWQHLRIIFSGFGGCVN